MLTCQEKKKFKFKGTQTLDLCELSHWKTVIMLLIIGIYYFIGIISHHYNPLNNLLVVH